MLDKIALLDLQKAYFGIIVIFWENNNKSHFKEKVEVFFGIIVWFSVLFSFQCF